MSDPVVTNVTYTQIQAQDATHFVWDVQFTAVTALGTRHDEHISRGTPALGLTVSEIKAVVLAIAVAHDNLEKNPPAPAVNVFAGTFDAVSGVKITVAGDPRLPPGVTP
jgi:hypothetical protein